MSSAQRECDTATSGQASEQPDDTISLTALEEGISEVELLAGRYELLGLVGAGGYGAVYKARDHKLDEIVALKMLRSEQLPTAAAIERFREEVRLARRISHPNVVRTYNLERHADQRLLSMEFVEGEKLTSYCRLGLTPAELLPVRSSLDVALQICAALSAIHGANIAHLDLKPETVIPVEKPPADVPRERAGSALRARSARAATRRTLKRA